MNNSRIVKVQVKIFDEEGKYALEEIKGLKEGDIITGTANDDCVHFTYNGADAVLFINSNCKIVSPKKSRRVSRRLPKGYKLDVCVLLEDENGNKEASETRADAASRLTGKIVNKLWVVRDWNTNDECYGVNYGEGDTKEEAIEDFWYNYNC